jgi:hypothetical protein
MRGRPSTLVYIVWLPFTEAFGGVIHLSVWASRETARRIAKKHGGLVIPRRVHPSYEHED